MDEISNRNFKSIKIALETLNRENAETIAELKSLNAKILQTETNMNNLRAEMFRMLANRPMGPTG